MPTNYDAMTNIATGIREGLITYQTIKNQQRQEQLLQNQLESQEKDRQLRTDQQSMQATQAGLIKGANGYELSPEMKQQREVEQGLLNRKKLVAERETREDDARSDESKRAKQFLEMLTGRKLGDLTANDVKQYSGLLIADLKAREAGLIKREAKDEKREEKEAQLAVPGYQRTGEVLPKPEEAMKLRKAVANAEQLSAKLNRLRDLVKDKGSFEWGGQAGTEMESLATEIQLLAKNEDMYQLGVLTGPDLSLLQKITADPASVGSLFTRDSSRLKQIDTQLKSITGKLESSAKASGYKKLDKKDPDAERYAEMHGLSYEVAKGIVDARKSKTAKK